MDWCAQDAFCINVGKIYGIMDDLRTESSRVQEKHIAAAKSLIASTDIDGFRIDTPMQARCAEMCPRYLRDERRALISAPITIVITIVITIAIAGGPRLLQGVGARGETVREGGSE